MFALALSPPPSPARTYRVHCMGRAHSLHNRFGKRAHLHWRSHAGLRDLVRMGANTNATNKVGFASFALKAAGPMGHEHVECLAQRFPYQVEAVLQAACTVPSAGGMPAHSCTADAACRPQLHSRRGVPPTAAQPTRAGIRKPRLQSSIR